MTDRLHDELLSEGEAWRGALGPDPDLSVLFHRRPPRRWAHLVAAAAVIIIVGVGAFLALDRLDWSSGGAAMSCTSPVLAVTPGETTPREPGHPASLGPVPRGTLVHVYGSRYLLPCGDDTVEVGQPLPPRRGPLKSVALTLVTADGRTRPLVTAHPDKDGSFAARVQIPPDAARGHATITTPDGARIVLVVK